MDKSLRKRIAAGVVAYLLVAAWIFAPGPSPEPHLVGQTLTAKGLVCPPNCSMIPTAEGTADLPCLPHRVWLAAVMRSK